jgi:hypothetical protein
MNKKQEYLLLIKKLISCENREQLSDTIKEINHFNREYSITSSSEEFKKFEIVIGLMRVKLKHKHGITENKINMNNKTNIFEELNKMKNLINAKAGTVISEQPVVGVPNNGMITKPESILEQDEYRNISFKEYRDSGKIPKGQEKYYQGSGTKRVKTSEFPINPKATSSKTPTEEELNKREARWKTDLKCVPIQPGAKKLVLKDRTTAYEINGIIYYNAGRKKLANNTMASYSCSTEFKTKKDRVKSNNNIKNLAPLTQDIQTAIGSSPSGKLSSQELDSILQRLGGNDVSSETSQEVQTTPTFPTDANGKPDLDKILASLAQ